jgi:hypothetical protein
MRVELRNVSKGPRKEALPLTSLTFSAGQPVLALAETEQRPTVLGLIASGRMASDTGTVAIDGAADAASLRHRVALVDAPAVSDPAPNVTVAAVTAEELMFAGRAASPLAVRRWLEANDFTDVARTPIADVTPSRRVRLLLELTALRKGVEGMVLVAPDRHGGSPAHWWEVVDEFASRGFAMLVIAGAAAAAVLEGVAERAEIPDAVTAAEGVNDVPERIETDADAEGDSEPATAPEPESESVPASESEPEAEPEPDQVEVDDEPTPEPEAVADSSAIEPDDESDTLRGEATS